MRLNLASELLCLPDDTPPAPHWVPDGSVTWQSLVAARVEALHRVTQPPFGPMASDPFTAGGLRHAALLSLLGQCIDAPDPATLELGLLAELLQAAATSQDTNAAPADFVAEPWRQRAVGALVDHLRRGDSHLSAVSMLGALVPVWRLDSHVVPAVRRWVWACTTPLATAQLPVAVAAASELFNECAALLCRLEGHSEPSRRDGVMTVAMSLSAIWSISLLHELRRRRRAQGAPSVVPCPELDAGFAKTCRRELAARTIEALRAIARLRVEPSLQRALRVFCSRQYDMASRSMLDVALPVSDDAHAGSQPRSSAPEGDAATIPAHRPGVE